MTHSSRARRHVVLALAVAVVAPLMFALPVAAAAATTTVLTSEPAAVETGNSFCLRSITTVDGGGAAMAGQIEFLDTTSGTPEHIWSYILGPGQAAEALHCFPDGIAMGIHSYRSIWLPNDSGTFDQSQDDITLDVGKATPDVHIETNGTIKANQPFDLYVFLSTGGDDYGTGGSVSIYRSGVVAPMCTFAIVQNASCSVSLPAGTYTLVAEFAGSSTLNPADSPEFELVVPADTVQATGVGVQYTTFFPVVDTYRDTLQIKGTRLEPIDVVIKIYSPGGSVLKSQTFDRATGGYLMTWNGRTGSGAIRPEGEYKIKQILRDAAGTTQTFTFFVKLSKKKLTWHSDSVTKNATGYKVIGEDGSGSVAVNSDGVVRLRSPDGFDGDWAAVGYEFKLKEGVTYKALKVAVLAKRGFVGGPITAVGSQNFSTCPYSTGPWFEACFDTWKSIGNAANSTIWYESNTLSASHRSGIKVRSLVSNNSGTTYVYKARVTYKYATLGY